MKSAKIISLIGGFFYSALLGLNLIVSFRVGGLYKDLDINYNPIPSLIIFISVQALLISANFGYYYYLSKKEKQGKIINNAVVYSLLIFTLPIFLSYLISIFSVILPIYNIQSAF